MFQDNEFDQDALDRDALDRDALDREEIALMLPPLAGGLAADEWSLEHGSRLQRNVARRLHARRQRRRVVAALATALSVGLLVSLVSVVRQRGSVGTAPLDSTLVPEIRLGAMPSVGSRPATSIEPGSTTTQTTVASTSTQAGNDAPWRTRSVDAGPLSDGVNSAEIVWAPLGDDLFVAGHDEAAILATGSGTWRPVASPPRSLLAPGAAIVWTGAELLFWGGSDPSFDGPNGEGLAYSPRTNTWRTMAAAPIDLRAPRVYGLVDGELMIWGGIRFDGPLELPASAPAAREYEDAASYDPSTNSWRPLNSNAPPGAAGVLFAVDSDTSLTTARSSASEIRPALYEASSDSWTVADAAIPAGDLVSAALFEAKLYVLVTRLPLDGGPALISASRWDSSNGWVELPAPPIGVDGVICRQSLTAIADQLVARRCQTSARFHNSTWHQLPGTELSGWLIPIGSAVLEVGDNVVTYYGT